MNLPKYELKAEDSFRVFEFFSVGSKGRILKVIEFTELSSPGIYNLAFGDKNLETGGIDDLAISDNGDREKILATVASAIHNFTEFNKEATVYAIGSTNSRTRLYRMGISRYLEEATTEFYIFGLNDGHWEEFNKETNYAAFLVKKK